MSRFIQLWREKSIAAKEVFELAKEQGYSVITLKRAKKELKIISYKDSNEDGKSIWYWKRRIKQEDEYSKKVNNLLSKMKVPKLLYMD